MSAQCGKKLPTVGGCEGGTGQDSPSPDQLADRIRDVQTSVTTAFSNAIDRAIDAGETLIIAKKSKLIPHGQWGKLLTLCGVGERQAERYMRLAWQGRQIRLASRIWQSSRSSRQLNYCHRPSLPRIRQHADNRRSTESPIGPISPARTSPLPGSADCRMSGREPPTLSGSTNRCRRCHRNGGRRLKA